MKRVLLMLTLSLMAACGQADRAAKSEDIQGSQPDIVELSQAQYTNAGIELGTITKAQVPVLLRLSGKIDVPPQNMVSVSVALGGYLKKTGLLPGMHVGKGDIIAEVEDRQYIELQQDYLTAKAKLAFLEQDFIRQKELNQSKASSDRVYQQAEADFKTQQIAMNALAQKLMLIGIEPAKLTATGISRTIYVRSPIQGYVSKVNVNIGKYVAPTEVLFELIDPSDIHLALRVYEKDVSQLFIGQKILAYTNNEPDRKHECEVLLIGRDVALDRSVEVHCHFEAYDKVLIPGTFMNAEVATGGEPVDALPSEAIVRDGGANYVFVPCGDRRLKLVQVTTGNTSGSITQIISSAKPLTGKVVVKGAYTLLMALRNKAEE